MSKNKKFHGYPAARMFLFWLEDGTMTGEPASIARHDIGVDGIRAFEDEEVRRR